MVILSAMLAVRSRAGVVLARRARLQTPSSGSIYLRSRPLSGPSHIKYDYCAGGAATGGLGLGCFFGAAADAPAWAAVLVSVGLASVGLATAGFLFAGGSAVA